VTTAPVDRQYPPAQHILRDLRITVEHRPDGSSTGWLPITPHVCNPSGSPRAGVLAVLVDVIGGGLAAIAARPDWIATADLTLHLTPFAVTGQVEAHGHVLRQGRTTVVIEVTLHDTTGRSLGIATMSFAVLPRRADNLSIDQADKVVRMAMATPSSGLVEPFHDRARLTVIDALDGAVALPLTDYVVNSMGAIQGGMVAAAGSAAAEAALTNACGVPLETVDLQITYLALAKVGPIHTQTTVLTASPDFGTAHVEIVDSGADNRVTTLVRAVAARA
jgi:uncharacterized protein (TIGR00369 family)